MANQETKIVITAATAQAEAALKSFTGQFKSMIGVVSGALSVGAFANLIKSSIDLQDEFDNLSKKVSGLSAKDFAGLKFTAEQTGVPLELIAKAANELAINIGKSPDKFAKLGITAKDMNGALIQTADIVASMPEGMQKTQLLAELMGKKLGPEMADFLSQGGAALQQYIAKGQDIYKFMDAEKAAQFKDQMAELQARTQGLGMALSVNLLPGLTETATAMNKLAQEGHPVLALWRGLAGMGKVAWDFLMPPENLKDSLSYATRLKEQQEKVASLQRQVNGGWGETKTARLKQELAQAEQVLATMVKHQKELEKPAQSEQKKVPKAVADVLSNDQKNGLEVLRSLERDYQNELAKRKDALNAPLLSASERQLADDLRAVHKRAQDARVELEKQKAAAEGQGKEFTGYQDRLKQITEEENKQVQALTELRAAQDALNQSFTYGAKTALREYLDEVNNTAKQSKELMSASFKGMEDSIAKFFRTGTLSIESLKNTILDMLAQIAAKKAMSGLLGLFGGMSSPSSTGASGFMNNSAGETLSFAGGGFTGTGSRSGGMDGQGGFLAMLHPNETVIDHARGQSVGGGINITYAPTIQIDSRTDQAEVRRLVEQSVRQGNAELVDRLQRQGAI